MHKPKLHQGNSQQQECSGHCGRKLSERKDQGNVNGQRERYRRGRERTREGKSRKEKEETFLKGDKEEEIVYWFT